MVENKQYVLVVVSVQSGRFFPKRARWQVSVEAKFDGEHLGTDPVDHLDSPDIGTELAWELDKKSLRQHRLNRTPIKLQVFALEASQQRKENIGLVMIDLKKADQRPLQFQWYPLLNCSYHNSRPELRVGIKLETDPKPAPIPPQVADHPPSSTRNSNDKSKTSTSQSVSSSSKETSSIKIPDAENAEKNNNKTSGSSPNKGGDEPSPVLFNPELYQMIHNLAESARNARLDENGGGDQGGGGGGAAGVVTDTSDLRATSEYQTALELQLWKEQQQQQFMIQLRRKEAERMRILSEEWKKRDIERELLIKQKLAENEEMEEKLKNAILQVEKREKIVAKTEAELSQTKVELVRDYEKRSAEMSDACSRMEQDCVHKIDIEKEKRKVLEGELERLKEELLRSERRVKDKEAEFELFRQQLDLKPEVRLQSQINVLTLEKVELERKVEALGSSKAHYKQEWGKALKELFKLKQHVQEQNEIQVRRQQQELQHMRLVHLAAEEKKLAKNDKDEIDELKNEIVKLKESRQLSDGEKMNGSKDNIMDQSQEELESHVTRLIEERDTLLRTGVYNSSDKIIIDLDRQIRDAIAAKTA